MDFRANKDALNKVLEHFISLLEEMLPRYAVLLRKSDISSGELKELGEIEHFLIEVNAKISVIKGKLEQKEGKKARMLVRIMNLLKFAFMMQYLVTDSLFFKPYLKVFGILVRR